MRYITTDIRHLVTRPLIAAAGAVAAAYAISPAAYAVPSTSAAPGTPAIILCGASHDLRVRIAPGPPSQLGQPGQHGGAAGDTYYTLRFTNTGSAGCALSGYPAVSAITRAGKQLGSPAGHGLLTVIPKVILAPGATAHTTLVYHSRLVSAGSGCGPVENAFELRVGLAGQKFATYVAFRSRACSRAGHVYLTITEAVRSGAG